MGWRWGPEWAKGVKRYKFPVINYISHGFVTYSMGTTVNNTVLHIQKWLREYILKVLITGKKIFVAICDDGY